MEKELTLVGHLEELRRRIIISLAMLIVASVLAFPLASKALEILKAPSAGLIERLVFFTPQEAFLIHLKISLFIGLVLSMPVILYQLWAFISPAIEERVKRHGMIFLISSVGAFISGALFGFFLLVPTALKFLLSFSRDTLEPVISVSSYMSFVMGLVLGSGLVFEMPVLSYILSKLGVITPHFLRSKWKYAVILIFIIAAVVTPTPDVFNMTILALPMLGLYELSIWVSKLAGRKKIAG
ncbi:MAG: twin-arginine translocase subunit TatC [Candidatus Omnitrophica bacterium]|nr:twin-arginine translocase subunit TatC [Candidatus Omnitrophota bacterium]